MPDMAKYLRLQLSANPAVVESHKPLVSFKDDFSIGYFWNIGNNPQLGTHYVHHGGVPRAQSYAYVVPKYQLGVFIITNQSGDDTARRHGKFAGAYFRYSGIFGKSAVGRFCRVVETSTDFLC